jgi:fluoroquinolone transport system ATP-binding protein
MASTDTVAMIQVSGLTFAYPGGHHAVQDVSFEVAAGEIFGLLGPSGSGKSTTQRILTGGLHPYRGSARVLGRELRDWDHGWYRHIGVGFELPNHFLKLTAMENLAYFASFYPDTLDPGGLLASLGLEEARDRRVEQFSKGMKMRLNVARALLHRPEVLFLDEPTSGLDPATARAIKDRILAEKRAGKCIVLTTHAMQDAEELCDRVAFIVDGVIRVTGSPAELRNSFGQQTVTVRRRLDGNESVATFPLSGLGENADFLAALRTGRLLEIRSGAVSLEDVFVSLTGRKLS